VLHPAYVIGVKNFVAQVPFNVNDSDLISMSRERQFNLQGNLTAGYHPCITLPYSKS